MLTPSWMALLLQPTQVQRGVLWVWGKPGAAAELESRDPARQPLLDLLQGEQDAQAGPVVEILRPFMRDLPCA